MEPLSDEEFKEILETVKTSPKSTVPGLSILPTAEADDDYTLRKARSAMFFDDETMLNYLAEERFGDDPTGPFRYQITPDGKIMYEDNFGNLQPEFVRPEDATIFDEYLTPNLVPATTFVADVGGGMAGAKIGFERSRDLVVRSGIKHPFAATAVIMGGTALGGGLGNLLVGGTARTGRELLIDQFYNLPPEEIAAAAKDLGVSSAFSMIPFGTGTSKTLIKKFKGNEDSLTFLANLKATVEEKVRKAKEMGYDITVAEAATMPQAKRAADIQYFLSRQPGIMKIQKLYQSRAQKAREAIETFADSMTQFSGDAMRDPQRKIAEAANKAITTLKNRRKTRATKIYDTLRETDNTVELTPVINQLDEIINNPSRDALLREAASEFKDTLMVKRVVDGQEISEPLKDLMSIHDRRSGSMEAIVKKNLGTSIAGDIIKLRESVTKAMDDANPTYAFARRVYDPTAPSIQAVERSAIGTLANFYKKGNDRAISRSLKNIFDPDVSAQSLRNTRRVLQVADPDTWQQTKKLFLNKKLDDFTKQTVEGGVPQFQKFFATPRQKNMMKEILSPEEFDNFYKQIDLMDEMFNRIPRGGSPTQPLQAMERAFADEAGTRAPKKVVEMGLSIIRLPGTIVRGGLADNYLESIKLKQLEGYYNKLTDLLIDPDATTTIRDTFEIFNSPGFRNVQLMTRGAAEGKQELEDQSAVISDERAKKILEELQKVEDQLETPRPMNYQFMPQTSADVDLFEDLPIEASPSGINPAMSPTLLPSEQDREIAMRMQQPGIAGLLA